MPIASLLNSKAQLVRRTQTGPPDQYGTPTWETSTVDLDPADPATPGGVHVQPATSDEIEDRPEGRVTYRAWLPAGVDVGPSDRLILVDHGLAGEVSGPPRPWIHPRSDQVHHIEVDLVEVDAFVESS